MAEKAESNTGWLFPVGDELNELGYNHMFAGMSSTHSIRVGLQRRPLCDGYVVNSILDAALPFGKDKAMGARRPGYLAGRTGLGKESHLTDYDVENYLIKEEITHYGAKKVILEKVQDQWGRLLARR